MHSHSYLNSAVKIIDGYTGKEPLSGFLKKYFAANKKYGSKDRKQVSHLCYCYFRLGKSLSHVPVEERILIGLFLCSAEPNEILQEIRPEWNLHVAAPVPQKLSIIDYSMLIAEVFPWSAELNEGVNHQKFCESFFIQPNLYLRIRPGHEQSVKDKLVKAETVFTEIEPGCVSLSNATKIESIVDLDREAVVQDLSSQQIGKYFQLPIANCQLPISVWDCCAGSGGKSLLLYDLIPNLDLTVSDIRESILANLKKRFAKAGIMKYRSIVADLTAPHSQFTIDHSPFDLIICDAPCTGSGTWSRTPEQLYFFDNGKIDHYASLQKKITSNVIPHLKPGGVLLYVTCSVFKKENEEIVDAIRQQFKLSLIRKKLIVGYNKKADTMFAAIFRS